MRLCGCLTTPRFAQRDCAFSKNHQWENQSPQIINPTGASSWRQYGQWPQSKNHRNAGICSQSRCHKWPGQRGLQCAWASDPRLGSGSSTSAELSDSGDPSTQDILYLGHPSKSITAYNVNRKKECVTLLWWMSFEVGQHIYVPIGKCTQCVHIWWWTKMGFAVTPRTKRQMSQDTQMVILLLIQTLYLFFFYLLIFYPFPLILRSLCFKNSPWPSHNTVEQNRNPITVFLFAQFEGEENRLAPMARGSGSLCQGAGWNQRIAVCDWHPWLFITLTAALCTYFFCRRGGCSVCWLRTSHDGAVAFHDICFWVTWGKWKPVFLQYPCTVWPSTWCAV